MHQFSSSLADASSTQAYIAKAQSEQSMSIAMEKLDTAIAITR